MTRSRVRLKSVREAVTQLPEQLLYARLLETGARIGLVVLLLSFAAYVFGLLEARVPPDQLPGLWSLPVNEYLAQTNQATGWASLLAVQYGDVAGLFGIVILSTCSVVCLLALVPGYWRRRDRIYVVLCLAEVAVIVLAASGWLAGGH
jgi:hypothetical protein